MSHDYTVKVTLSTPNPITSFIPLFLLEELLPHPRRTQACHLFIDRAPRLMRSRQIPRGHEELVDDLSAGKDERFLQDLNTITTVKG